jgi:5-formyltetrahydrofolate cyclo-ligase
MSEKRALRRTLLAARAALDPQSRQEADDALVAAARLIIRGAARVAAHVPMPGEPGGAGLPESLAAELPPLGLLLPSLMRDHDLDWAAYDGELTPARQPAQHLEPAGHRLGVDTIAVAEIVLVPAVAVDVSGARLGRGGGSYDRALARVRPGVPVIALLYRGELLPALPVEPHDRRVTAVLTPDGLVAVGS